MNYNRQGPGGPPRGKEPGMGHKMEPRGFGDHGPQRRDMFERQSMEPRRHEPPMDSRRHEPPRDHHSEGGAGTGLLGVLGAGIAAVVSAQEQAKEQEYQREQEAKREAAAVKEREAAEKKAQQELLEKIPAICPYCGAPTSGKVTCEFCGSNLLSKVSQ